MKPKNLLMPIIIAVGFIACCQTADNKTDIKPIIQKAEPGKTVFELLLAEHEVDYSKSGMGVFIKSIDGVKNTAGSTWIYYINGERANVACDNYIVSAGDKIEWRYE